MGNHKVQRGPNVGAAWSLPPFLHRSHPRQLALWFRDSVPPAPQASGLIYSHYLQLSHVTFIQHSLIVPTPVLDPSVAPLAISITSTVWEAVIGSLPTYPFHPVCQTEAPTAPWMHPGSVLSPRLGLQVLAPLWNVP